MALGLNHLLVSANMSLVWGDLTSNTQQQYFLMSKAPCPSNPLHLFKMVMAKLTSSKAYWGERVLHVV